MRLDRLLLDDLVAVVRGHDLLAVHAQVAGKNEVPRPVFVDQDELTERGINASETCDLGALAKKATRWPPVTWARSLMRSFAARKVRWSQTAVSVGHVGRSPRRSRRRRLPRSASSMGTFSTSMKRRRLHDALAVVPRVHDQAHSTLNGSRRSRPDPARSSRCTLRGCTRRRTGQARSRDRRPRASVRSLPGRCAGSGRTVQWTRSPRLLVRTAMSRERSSSAASTRAKARRRKTGSAKRGAHPTPPWYSDFGRPSPGGT